MPLSSFERFDLIAIDIIYSLSDEVVQHLDTLTIMVINVKHSSDAVVVFNDQWSSFTLSNDFVVVTHLVTGLCVVKIVAVLTVN